jgi:hypothetical protein
MDLVEYVCVDPCRVECAPATDRPLSIDLVSRQRPRRNKVNDLDTVATVYELDLGLLLFANTFFWLL